MFSVSVACCYAVRVLLKFSSFSVHWPPSATVAFRPSKVEGESCLVFHSYWQFIAIMLSAGRAWDWFLIQQKQQQTQQPNTDGKTTEGLWANRRRARPWCHHVYVCVPESWSDIVLWCHRFWGCDWSMGVGNRRGQSVRGVLECSGILPSLVAMATASTTPPRHLLLLLKPPKQQN